MTDTNPATITSFIQGMKIYPDYNYSGDIVVRVQTYYGGAIQDDFKTTISNSGVGTLSSRTATFNSSGTFTASVDEILYGRFYTTVVGGGGGGTYGGGGGGGGGINFYANLTSRSNYLDNRDYSIVVGTGGAANNNTPTNGTQAKGGTGGTSSAFGAVANGGEGGSFQYNFSGSGYYSYDLSGGDSGTATYLITTIPAGLGFDGSESVATSFTTTFGYGGGGGGSNGGDAPGQNIGINNDGKRGDSGGTKGGYGEGRLNTSSIPPGFAVSPNSGNGGNYGAFVNQTDIYATNGADGRVVIEITPK
jgi:hypothetical protein